MSAIEPHHCITCSDEGEELTVLRVDRERELALCTDAAGAHCSVEVALVGDVDPGDTLLVHAGTALLCVRATTTRPDGAPA